MKAGGREDGPTGEMHVGLTEVSVISSLRLCSPVALSLIGYLSGQVYWEQHLSPSLSP